MQPSIPASEFVNVIPSVLQAGAADLAMNAVFLDNSGDTSVPIGTLKQFGSAADVAAWYGAESVQATLAGYYFAGFTGATQIPSSLYFAQDNTAAVAGYLRGGPLALSLTQLQALSGTITLPVNGESLASAAINLSAATSFSNAAQLIQAGLQGGTTFTGGASQAASQNHMVVDVVTAGALHAGDVLSGAGVDVGLSVVSQVSGTPGGAGTYVVSTTTGFTSTTVTALTPSVGEVTCTYDSLRDAFVITSGTTGSTSTVGYPATDSLTTGLLLTQAEGAQLSPGAAAATPAGLMNTIIGLSTDWATFMNVQDPDAGAAGGPIKQAFAEWNATQHDSYMYVAFDSDPAPSEGTDGSCFAQQVADLDGTFPVWSATQGAAVGAFVCGIAAAIDFEAPGGRTTFAYRSSPALSPDITSLATYLALKGNGYNSYCAVATRTASLQWLQPGSISGEWVWADPYVNQIFWNARFQNDFAELETQVKNIPYTQAGYNMIRESLSADIQAMGAFGAWQAGVTLSNDEAIAVNTAAGLNISSTLQTQGWYLQVQDPGPTVRAARGSPTTTFWYTDGGSIQQITMGSVDIE